MRHGRWLIILACASLCFAQPPAPPKVLLLVRQQFKTGRSGARERLERATAAAYNQLDVPVYWMELQAFTGPAEALFVDSFDSFEAVEKAGAVLQQSKEAHPDLARLQAGIDDTVSAQRTILAVRVASRDVGEMNLTQARFLRMLVVRGRPGEEPPSSTALAPSVVYQVTSGMPSPAFIIFQSMTAFGAMPLPGVTQGEVVEDLLYVVEPEMSHVSREFARQGGAFWLKP